MRSRAPEIGFDDGPSASDIFRNQFLWSARFWKGRVALYAILRALGIGEGMSVLVPGYTCIVVPSAVRFAGAKPIYIDIAENEYNVDRGTVLEAWDRATEESDWPVRAIIVQHTYGVPANIGPILDLARERHVFVIEDCCHAIGSRVRLFDPNTGRERWWYTGTLGDASFFSSQWSKPVTSGLGGWAIARQDWLRGELLNIQGKLADPAFMNVAKLGVQVASYWTLFRPSLYWRIVDAYRLLSKAGLTVGSSDTEEACGNMPRTYGSSMSWMQSRLILHGLRGLDRYIEHRKRIRDLYDRALAAAGFTPLVDAPNSESVVLRYPLAVPAKEELIAEARKERIELGDWFNHPLHPLGWSLDDLGWRDGICPRAEEAARSVINLPMHSRIGERDVDQIVSFLANRVHGRALEPLAVG